ncbi:MAG: hypothetical protein WBO17_06530 [Sphingorhabdus sp.]
MATATSSSTPNALRTAFRSARLVMIAIVVLIALWLIWNWDSLKGQAKVGAAYGAHIACSCRYVSGRDLKSCKSDFEPGMGIVSISDDPDNKRIYASVPFLAEAVAERRGKFGCLQLNATEIDAI